MEITVELRGMDGTLQELARVIGNSHAAIANAMTRIGLIAHREARANAPRSPSAKIIRSLRKTRRKVRRKDRATSRPSPGGLERSIAQAVVTTGDAVDAVLFVAANSEAGQYAARIHDEKGVSWNIRGPGTVQKGSRADEKFIDRAVLQNEEKFVALVRKEIERSVA